MNLWKLFLSFLINLKRKRLQLKFISKVRLIRIDYFRILNFQFLLNILILIIIFAAQIFFKLINIHNHLFSIIIFKISNNSLKILIFILLFFFLIILAHLIHTFSSKPKQYFLHIFLIILFSKNHITKFQQIHNYKLLSLLYFQISFFFL